MRFTKSSSLKNLRFPSESSYGMVASKGKKLRFGLLKLKVLQAPDSCSRFCLVVKKKNGNAVFRNRCRRILRNVLFCKIQKFKAPVWVMVMVEMNTENADWRKLRVSAIGALEELCL